MELLKMKSNELLKNGEQKLIDSYNEVFSRNREKLVDLIESVISEHILGFPREQIETIVDNFFNDMEVSGQILAKKITDGCRESYNQLFRDITKRPNQNKTNLTEHSKSISEIFKNSHFQLSMDEFVDLINQIVKRIGWHLEPFYSISSRHIDDVLEDIRFDLKSELKKAIDNILYECDVSTQEVLARNFEKTMDNVEEYGIRNKEITREDIKPFMHIITKNGYELVTDDNKYYIKDVRTSKMYTFNINGNHLVLAGNKIVFSVNDQIELFNNFEKNERTAKIGDTVVASKTIKKGNGVPKDIAYEYAVIKTNKGYIFEYNGKMYTDKRNMFYIANEVAKIAPLYYEELMQDKKYQMIIADLETYDKSQREMEINRETGKITINPAKKESIINKLHIMGYELFEIDGVYYLKNATTGEERKIIPSKTGYGIGLEGVSPQEFNFNTDYVYESENNLNRNINFLVNGDIKVLFSNKLKTFFVRIGEKTYNIAKTKEGIACRMMINNQLVPVDNQDVLQILNDRLPSLAKYIEEYLNSKNEDPNDNTPPIL